jgi:hypothetical protein
VFLFLANEVIQWFAIFAAPRLSIHNSKYPNSRLAPICVNLDQKTAQNFALSLFFEQPTEKAEI